MISRKENRLRHNLRIQAQYKKHAELNHKFLRVLEDKCRYNPSTRSYIIPVDIEIYYRNKFFLSAHELFFLLIKVPISYRYFEIKRKKLGLTKEQYIRKFYEDQKKERFLVAIQAFEDYWSDFYLVCFDKLLDERIRDIDFKKYIKFAFPEKEKMKVDKLKKQYRSYGYWEGK